MKIFFPLTPETRLAMKPTMTTMKKSSIDPSAVLARTLMQKDVLALKADDTVETAVSLLEEYHVSGAPVVDDDGRPVGVFSVSDIARREHVSGDRLELEHPGGMDALDDEGDISDPEFFSREDYSSEVLGRVRVGEWMTDRVVSVDPEATLAEVCRLMLEESIHRVFVVEKEKLRGVVSSFDVVRLLAS